MPSCNGNNLALTLVIVMGVSGTGKSSVARQLADEFSLTYLDADTFHSEQAKARMANNQPLTDDMRRPWLARIVQHLSLLNKQGKSVVLAYSGLKRAHRQLFNQLPFVTHFFCLTGHKSIIAKRIKARENHFFSAQLLDSQLASFEAPLASEDNVVLIDIAPELAVVTDNIRVHLRSCGMN